MKEEESAFKKKVLKQFLSGDNLFGKDGALAPLLKEFLEESLQAEMEEHLRDDDKGWSSGNKRNGKGSKTVKSNVGEVTIDTPEDRHSSFEPKLIEKRQRILADNLEDQIIALYGMGSSMRDISAHIREMYDTEVSTQVISDITDRVIPKVKEWQNRPLEEVYCIVWLDAMHFKVREDGKVRHKALYNVLGINKKGKKELLGMYLVHQIRNSLKYVASKEQKEFAADLKLIYGADTKDGAESALLDLEEKWGKKYPVVIRSWNSNWERLSAYFAYTKPIRKIIYTTNAVEGYHRQVRKVTKTKGAFTSDMALLKLVYLAAKGIERKWTAPIHNWGLTVQQFAIRFEGRLVLDVE